MKFSQLPLKTKKTILIIVGLAFAVAFTILPLCVKSFPGIGAIRLLLLIGWILSLRSLRQLRNIEKGLPVKSTNPDKIHAIKVSALLIGIAAALAGVSFYFTGGFLALH